MTLWKLWSGEQYDIIICSLVILLIGQHLYAPLC